MRQTRRSYPIGWRPRSLALATALVALVACGDERAPARGSGDAAGAAGSPDPGATVLAGEIVLEGELAGLERAAVFVIGFEAGTNQLVLVDKLELSSAEPRAAGGRRLPFALGTSHTLTGGRIEALELEVRVDLDGIVDGPDDVVGRTRVPVELGDLDVRVELDDEARTDVALGG